MESVRPWLEFVIDKCRVWLYYGQMDLRDSYVASRDFISVSLSFTLFTYYLSLLFIHIYLFIYKLKDLKWSGTKNFKKAKRQIWKVEQDVAGYVRSYGNLTEIMVRNAGHFVPMDQPKWALDMFNRFIFNVTFS